MHLVVYTSTSAFSPVDSGFSSPHLILSTSPFLLFSTPPLLPFSHPTLRVSYTSFQSFSSHLSFLLISTPHSFSSSSLCISAPPLSPLSSPSPGLLTSPSSPSPPHSLLSSVSLTCLHLHPLTHCRVLFAAAPPPPPPPAALHPFSLLSSQDCWPMSWIGPGWPDVAVLVLLCERNICSARR